MSANSNILNRELSNPMKDEPSRFTDDTERSISLSIDGTEFKSGSSFREKDFLNSKSESNLNGSKLIDSLQILCKIPGFLKDQENLFEYTRCNVEQIRHPRVYSDLNFVSKKSSSSINDVECFVSSLRIDAPEKQSYNGYTSTNTSRTMYYNAFDKSHYTYFKSDSDRCKFAKNEKDTKETRSKSQMVAMETISQHITEQVNTIN